MATKHNPKTRTDTLKLNKPDADFIRQLEGLSGQSVNSCYQCGKCTAGCPIARSVEVPPHQIIRLAQLGLKEQVLSVPTIWYCLSCVTCTARCPKGVDLACIMDSLREMAMQGGAIAEHPPNIKFFERLFLEAVRKHGRLYEMGALAKFNLYTLNPFQDIGLLWPLLEKGKLGLRPPDIRGKAEIERIFQVFGSSRRL